MDIFSTPAIAALTGLTFLAYHHSIAYLRIFPYLMVILTALFALMFFAHEQLGLSAPLPTAPLMVAYLFLNAYLVFLRHLREIIE
jgi:hypothetical protein